MVHLFHRQFTQPPNSLASVSYGFRRLPAPKPQNSRTTKQQNLKTAGPQNSRAATANAGGPAEMAGRFAVPGSRRVSSVFG